MPARAPRRQAEGRPRRHPRAAARHCRAAHRRLPARVNPASLGGGSDLRRRPGKVIGRADSRSAIRSGRARRRALNARQRRLRRLVLRRFLCLRALLAGFSSAFWAHAAVLPRPCLHSFVLFFFARHVRFGAATYRLGVLSPSHLVVGDSQPFARGRNIWLSRRFSRIDRDRFNSGSASAYFSGLRRARRGYRAPWQRRGCWRPSSRPMPGPAGRAALPRHTCLRPSTARSGLFEQASRFPPSRPRRPFLRAAFSASP